MNVSLRLALVCVIGSAVTGCGAAPDTEGRLKDLEAKLEAQSLLLDDLTCQVSQMEEHQLGDHFRDITSRILAQDRWNQVAPPGFEYSVTPIREMVDRLERLMADMRNDMMENHEYRKIDEIIARRKWKPLSLTELPPSYTPMTNRNAEK